MSMERGKKVRALFEAARLLAADRRESFLDKQCGGDDELREELRSLLEAHDGAPEFLSSPVLGDDFQVGERFPDSPEPIPERIGKYRILSVLGEGGMGTVYEAEQESPQRRVALKVVGAGLCSPRVLQRFRLEAELLARLQHPGIAQIFEAGTFSVEDTEKPYIAMELVEGLVLTEYVEKHHLSFRQRLKLMAEICDAVHHAHQKSVIHRDLKPANILVDATGCPKILDFGIATATDSDLQVTTAGTELGQVLGTLPYMSPEQVQGKLSDVDTRSDIYALGVICYRLLSGRLPLDLRDIAIAEAARVIAEQDPERLSGYDRTFRGDIETIVAKALEKESKRRYQSASDMGEDIQRFLRHETITARPASAWYQFRKFSRRNRGLVTGAAVAIFGLVAGIIGMSITLQRAVGAEAVARIEADKAGAVSRFFQDLLSSVDPEYGPGKEVTVRQMLDGAAEDLEGSFETQPEVRAVLHDTIGLTYRNIGNLDGAREHLEEALVILEAEPDADQENLASTMNHLAGLYWRLDLTDEAESLVRRALEIRMGLHGGLDERTLELQNNLSILLRIGGKLEEAEALARSALQAKKEITDDDTDPSVLTGMNTLASLLDEQGKFGEAEPLYAHVLDSRRKTLGDMHPDTLGSIHNMATFYQSNSRLEEAETHAREALKGYTEIYDRNHPRALRSLDVLVSIMGLEGKLEEAEPLARDLLTRREELLGPDHRDTVGARETLVMILREGGNYTEAEKISREVVAFFLDRLGEDHSRTLSAKYNLAKLLFEEGQLDEAASLFRNITMKADEVLPGGHRYRGVFREKLGQCLVSTERFDEAETVLLRGVEICEENGIDSEYMIGELISLYERWEKPDEAERWRSRLADLKGSTEATD
jgi:tetratricopeptide (TPR) repeat protein